MIAASKCRGCFTPRRGHALAAARLGHVHDDRARDAPVPRRLTRARHQERTGQRATAAATSGGVREQQGEIVEPMTAQRGETCRLQEPQRRKRQPYRAPSHEQVNENRRRERDEPQDRSHRGMKNTNRFI